MTATLETPRRESRVWTSLRQFLKDPMAMSAAVVILLILFAAIFAPLLTSYSPSATDADASLAPMSRDHWLGTDQLGRDIYSRILYGARLTLMVSFGAVVFAVCVGGAIGILSGLFGGPTDSILMRLMDILLAFPGLILAIVLAAMMGPGILTVIIAVGVSGTPTFARVARASTFRVVVEEYVTAAKSIGTGSWRLAFRHIIPNIAGPIVVLATLYLAYAVLTAAALSFLGVGIRPPTPEWGAMVNDGRDLLAVAWWVSVFPGCAIVLFVLSVNVLGDRLRDQLDVSSEMAGV